MAIEKNNFKVSRFDYEFSPGSKKSISSDEDEQFQRRTSAVESDDDDDDGYEDADSGAGSDDFDLLELGDTGVEFCHVGNQTCSIPFELYDLSGLEDILSVDVWNECLSEEERFSLSKFLPDMDQETFMVTLKELFMGSNFHFGSPIKRLFSMLKGGLCEPRVALYHDGLKFFQRRQHYHLLRRHQNNMVSSLCQMRDAWLNYRGYSMEERLRILNLIRSQKSFKDEKIEGLDTDESERVSGEGFLKMFKDKKMRNFSAYTASSNLDFPSGGQLLELHPPEYGKQNPKGTSKLAGSKLPPVMEPTVRLPSVYHDLDMNSRPYGSAGDHPQLRKVAGYDSGSMLRLRDELRIGNVAEEPTYGKGAPRDRKVPVSIGMDRGGFEAGKKYEAFRGNIFENFVGLPLSSKGDLFGKNKNANLFSKRSIMAENPVDMRTSYNLFKKTKLPENAQSIGAGGQIKSSKGSISQVPRKGIKVDSEDHVGSLRHNKTQGKALLMDPLLKTDDWSLRGKKWKTGRESPDLNYKAYRSPSPQINEESLLSELRTKPSQKKIRGRFVQKAGPDPASSKRNKKISRGEETESDSSEQCEDDEDSNPLLRSKLAYPSVMEVSQSSLLNSALDAKKAKYVKKDVKEHVNSHNALSYSKKIATSPQHGYPLTGVNNLKKKQGKIQDSGTFEDHSSKGSGKSYLSVLDKFSDDDDEKKNHKMLKNGRLKLEGGKRLHKSSSKAFAAEGKQKGRGSLDLSVMQSRNLHDYAVGLEDDSHGMRLFEDDYETGRFAQTGQQSESLMGISCEKPDGTLLGCNSIKKKRKVKGDVTELDRRDEGELQSNTLQQIKDSTSLKKKTKKKQKSDSCGSDMGTSEPPATEMGTVDMDLETKPQKVPFPLITPTVHTGFSFSIVHLLSAVRIAMITPLPEDMLEPIKEKKMREGDNTVDLSCDNNVDVNNVAQAEEVNTPSLTVQEIVNRVKSNPGDPCILETQEPLQDLVRGVLKIFSSKTAPLGAKGWKMLTVYEKSAKTWSWIGPVSQSSSDYEAIEEVTSPEAWGLPHKMLVKLVDSFANWLKSGQETLQQIGSLPAPPASLMQFNVDEKERFRDLRAQKSLNTISSSSEEVRAYFRQEEVLRYSIPDRAFSYTAADGKKSIVAPLRRCGGKPTSKARDHFMLKKDRPPHVTILCLVRDAAARLPGSIGTRADVCTLIRDSQYIVEDVSDAQVNQVVSGALDRLHYERDPCVQFDGERKLWVYLHREREEEDFEDDGTSSTKKWKRPKKDGNEQSDHGIVTVAYHASGEQTGYDMSSDLNTEPPPIDDAKGMEQIYGDVRQNLELNVNATDGSELDDMCQGPKIMEASNPMEEKTLLCQENSTNEDFDDEAFGRERPVGLLSASIS